MESILRVSVFLKILSTFCGIYMTPLNCIYLSEISLWLIKHLFSCTSGEALVIWMMEHCDTPTWIRIVELTIKRHCCHNSTSILEGIFREMPCVIQTQRMVLQGVFLCGNSLLLANLQQLNPIYIVLHFLSRLVHCNDPSFKSPRLQPLLLKEIIYCFLKIYTI